MKRRLLLAMWDFVGVMQHIRVKKKRLFYVLGTTLLQIKRRKKEF
jgi:hypothetical protein